MSKVSPHESFISNINRIDSFMKYGSRVIQVFRSLGEETFKDFKKDFLEINGKIARHYDDLSEEIKSVYPLIKKWDKKIQIFTKLLNVDYQKHDPMRVVYEQAMILFVSAIEVYIKDRMILAVNKRPDILLDDALSKKFSLLVLKKENFNLEKKIGYLLFSDVNFKNMKSIIRELEKISIDLENVAKRNNIDLKFISICTEKRNLLLHNSGIIDERYIEATKEKVAKGNKIGISEWEVKKLKRQIILLEKVLEEKLSKKTEEYNETDVKKLENRKEFSDEMEINLDDIPF